MVLNTLLPSTMGKNNELFGFSLGKKRNEEKKKGEASSNLAAGLQRRCKLVGMVNTQQASSAYTEA